MVITFVIEAGHFISQAVKNKNLSWFVRSSSVLAAFDADQSCKGYRGYCFYSGLFDPSFPCPCRAKLAGQRSLWWSDMAFLPVRSLGPVYLHACLKETQGLHTNPPHDKNNTPSCLITDKLSGGKTHGISVPLSVNQKQLKGRGFHLYNDRWANTILKVFLFCYLFVFFAVSKVILCFYNWLLDMLGNRGTHMYSKYCT